jgi:hypothetical protein
MVLELRAVLLSWHTNCYTLRSCILKDSVLCDSDRSCKASPCHCILSPCR